MCSQPVSDLDALCLTQIPAALDRRRCCTQDRIDDTRDAITDNHATVLPPMPRLAIDTQLATRSRVAHPLMHQPTVDLTLLRHWLTTRPTIRIDPHSYLQKFQV